MIYDVTVPITGSMPVWPGDPPVTLTAKSHESRDGTHTVRLTAIEMSSHTGTHLDAPYHMIGEGRRLEDFPLETLTGGATVVENSRRPSIGRSDLDRLKWNGIERVLFKTDNSAHWRDGQFYEKFVYLEPDGAEFLAQLSLKLVGI